MITSFYWVELVDKQTVTKYGFPFEMDLGGSHCLVMMNCRFGFFKPNLRQEKFVTPTSLVTSVLSTSHRRGLCH